MPLRGGLLSASSHTVFEGKTQSYEYLRIEPRPDGVYYVVRCRPDSEETAFKLAAARTRRRRARRTIFTFEQSRGNDFPAADHLPPRHAQGLALRDEGKSERRKRERRASTHAARVRSEGPMRAALDCAGGALDPSNDTQKAGRAADAAAQALRAVELDAGSPRREPGARRDAGRRARASATRADSRDARAMPAAELVARGVDSVVAVRARPVPACHRPVLRGLELRAARELAPEVGVLDRLPVRGLPAVASSSRGSSVSMPFFTYCESV